MGTIMKNKTIRTLALQATVALSLVASSYANAAQLLNSSYDIARELFTQLNSDFKTQWDAQHPDDKVTIKQSHAGSSKQALAILQGLPADAVTYNQVTDVQILHDKGKLIPADWQQRLPNNSSPYYYHCHKHNKYHCSHLRYHRYRQHLRYIQSPLQFLSPFPSCR